MKSYLIGFLLAGTSTVTLVAGAFFAAISLWPQNFIAPAISSVATVNEKLRFIRRRPELNPQVVAVGSSIAWRQIDGAALSAGTGAEFLNGASALLAVHQTRYLTKFYTARFPRASTFVLLTNLTDFEECSQNRRIFELSDAADYSRGKHHDLIFYMKYLTFARYYSGFHTFPSATRPLVGDRWLDEYGSSPLQVMDHGLRYGPLKFDRACIDELKQLSKDVRVAGRQLAVVIMPTRPSYLAKFPEAATRLETIVREIRPQLREDENLFVDLRKAAFEEVDYWDAFHLQWPAVRRLTAGLGQELAQFVQNGIRVRDIQTVARCECRSREPRNSDETLQLPSLR